jgi:hypothetical protein
MPALDHVTRVDLGQSVRRRGASAAERTGCIVGVLLVPPYSVLVRWRDAEATFEALENLISIEVTLF